MAPINRKGWNHRPGLCLLSPVPVTFLQRFFLAASSATLGFALLSPASAQVQITEFLASNTRILMDQDREYSDWIELHNPTPDPVNLGGWFLTDRLDDLTQWRFPSTNLAPNGFLVVFASGKNRATAGAQLHTNFRLSATGEYLALVRPDGLTIASHFAPAFPEQDADISYGTFQEANYYFLQPSPGAANTAGFVARVADTKFSHDRGFHDAPFSLTISCATPDAQIRYTTNGSPPSATNGLVYSAPLPITATTCLRAIALRPGHLPSNIDTQTYLFVDDIIRQATNGVAPPGWPSSWGQNTVDYGMDPDVVNHPNYRATIRDDLKSIPSFSIVTDLKHLFNPSTGIYANPSGDEIAWERPTSLELIHPDGADGFQIDCGIRIRGGFSRSTQNPKHAFRFFFRSEYGAAKLNYPLFGDEGAASFEKIDLRTGQNYSWSFQNDSRCIQLRDQFSRDAQLAMGRPAKRGRFYHLYVNGLYWGLYNTDERADAAYGASYFGGREEEYDTIKVDPDIGYIIEATDGTQHAWRRLWNAATNGFAADANYQRVQGRNPDGSRNPAYENLLDVPALIDYMLVVLYGGNLDAPISNFLGNSSPNNFFAVRHTNGLTGFRFFAHDSEHTLLNVNEDRTGPYAAGDPTRGSNLSKSNPQYLWQRLQANPEFRVLVGDHVHRHFFNGGVLTPEACATRFLARSNEIYRAMVCESARWGDAKNSTPYTRDGHWIPAMNTVATFLRNRSAVVLQQLRTDNLYPTVTAPSFNQHGGPIPHGFSLTLSAPAGTLYVTLDGSDPRLPGGNPSPAARIYAGPLTLTESADVRARLRSGTTWSALNEASFIVIQTYRDLFITEIMYHPPDDATLDGDELEFLELKNVGDSELDLSGVHFTNGIAFRFPNGSRLPPGAFAVLASNADAFTRRYPATPLAGTYSGRLANSGERLTLAHAVGTPIFSVAYRDDQGWPTAADGLGFSLVPTLPNVNPDPDLPLHWRASAHPGGSPGADDPAIGIPQILVTEILTHTDLPQLDAVELFNPGPSSADLSYWFLTDDRTNPAKFQLPPGTVLPPGGYRVFDERDFNPNPGSPTSFLFDSHGEQVYLFSANPQGTLTGYSDGFAFPAAANGVTFGRHTNSTGLIQYPPQTQTSLGTHNLGPRFGPVVLNEIHYHPTPGESEFVELLNLSDAPVPLYDPELPANTWIVDGLDFRFPTGTTLSPRGLLVIAGSDPTAFRQLHGIPDDVPVLGPFNGSLQNNGETITLRRPDSPDLLTNGTVFVPYLLVDSVRYDNRAPWPTNAAGLGPSLERIHASAYGDDPINWRASFGPPSPGLDNHGNRRPTLTLDPAATFTAGEFPASLPLNAAASDDGLPSPPAQLAFAWSTASGPAPVVFLDPASPQTTAWFPGTGTFVIQLTAHDGELQAVAQMTVTVTPPAEQFTLIPQGATWRYLDDGSNQGSAWRQPTFDDSSWPAGPAQLGYSSNPPEGDEATVLSFGPNASAKYVTYYFRHAFDLPNASTTQSLLVRLLRDDGGIVYLNNVEVFRSNMPTGDVTSQTTASSAVGGADETTNFYDNTVDPALLVNGRNVLAVEIHQANATSSDLSFDLELSGVRSSGVNHPPQVNAGPDLDLPAPTTTLLQGLVRDDGLPTPPGAFTNLWSQIDGPAPVAFAHPTLYRTLATFPQPGTYQLRLSAGDGASTVADNLSVLVRDDAYNAWRLFHFTAVELANPDISGDDADPDHDRQSNRDEFLSGTLPRDPASVLRLDLVHPTDNNPALRLRLPVVSGHSYSLLASDSLSSDSWSRLQDIPTASTDHLEEILIPLPPTPTTRYYRVVTPALPNP